MATAADSSEDYSEEETSETEDGEEHSPEDVFFKAILDNDVNTVKTMVSQGYNAMTRGPYCDMALHFACLNNKLDILNVLKDTLKEGEIDTINIEEDDTICGTALHMAMDGQVNPKIVDALLSWGANPNAVDAKGSSVLHELIYRAWEDLENEFESEHRMRLSTSFDFNEEDVGFNTDASGVSYFVKLYLLHKKGVDMNNIHVGTGLTPLHYWSQIFNCNMDYLLDNPIPEWCISFLSNLLKFGADVNAMSLREESVMSFFAERKFKPTHVDFMNSYTTLLSSLIPKVHNISSEVDLFSRTLLHFTAEFSNHVLLAEILKFQCDVNVKDKFGLSPLHLITHNLTTDESEFVKKIIEMLLKHGANVDIQDEYGSTPLHHAVHLKNHIAVEWLLKFGASPNTTDKFDRTVKELDTIEGDLKILEYLGIARISDGREIERGKSDIRFGWFYPLCCHKVYDAESKGIEEPENVKNESVHRWLDTFPMCTHNTRTILQNSMSSLEENKEQMSSTLKDAIKAKQDVFDLMKKVSALIENRNPLFASNILFGGSVSENTKVGSPDEVDFVFDLYKFRDIITIDEADRPGFAKIRVVQNDYIAKYGLEEIVDDHNYINRTNLSKLFHKIYEECLRVKLVLDNNRLFFWRGTTNTLGECSDIGQMDFIWYGPFEKRLTISVDIAPVIRLEGWQSTHINKNIQILEKHIVESTGCYLVMKNLETVLTDDFGNEEELDTNNYAAIANDEFLFKISLSQLEHATMKLLPKNIRNGYKIAKSIQLQCPNILFPLDVACGSNVKVEFINEDGECAIHVAQYLTSFVLKTALFHEMDSRGIRLNCISDDFCPDKWNDSIVHAVEDTTSSANTADIRESLSWALCIYKRLSVLVQKHKTIPEYFMPLMKATKCPSGNDTFVKICGSFLKVLIYLFEHFKLPPDLDFDQPKVMYTRMAQSDM